jgi:hypothetical protein
MLKVCMKTGLRFANRSHKLEKNAVMMNGANITWSIATFVTVAFAVAPGATRSNI